ncbi:hypothetical protein Scep_005107 [Stephania cephalantha]|uniref:Myosin motor domain-containing protein n=1 Tax=Stephania cephalantha TaxID=152367 RepID=A0AAP0KTN7_9MAGN
MTRAYAQSLINIVLSLKCRNVETIVQWSPYSSEDELLDQDFPVWCLLTSGQWQLGKVHSTSGEDARVMLSDGKALTMPKGIVLPANPNILEDTDDLIQLSFLNEPSVFHNLCCRYSQNKSYTKAGPVLLAMNPFKGAEIHGNELVSGCGKKPRVSPGIYYWAKDAFIAMMNDEGKLIDIHFKPTGKVFGAKIQTCKFHLDFKMRVIQLAEVERSFYVFYQLYFGAPSSLKGCIMLIDVSIHDEKQ